MATSYRDAARVASAGEHRGRIARAIAQPEVAHDPPFALRGDGSEGPAERAILRGLGR